MIDSLKMSSLNKWLTSNLTNNKGVHYRHNFISEVNNGKRAKIVSELKPLVQTIHDDTRLKLRDLFQDDWDPLKPWTNEIDPAEGYPEKLDLTTLKGYFGEIFSGIIAENFMPFDEGNWRVPLFPFRFHSTAFDQLELYRQTGKMKKATYGRTGDDCVAFSFNNGVIDKVLFLEAKCTATHKSSMINDAHEKISSEYLIPVETLRLVEGLRSYRKIKKEAQEWIDALRAMYSSRNVLRYDCVSYLCGQKPKRSKTWITTNAPNVNYKGNRELETVEIHISDIDELIKEIYGKED
ncbi:MAG: hypothetical protein ABS938_00975 [Psychrobacillus psychrodurans]